jgi:hypothetical protein
MVLKAQPFKCMYIDNKELEEYTGLNRFNLESPDYPITQPSLRKVWNYDNISCVFSDRTVYMEKAGKFRLCKDEIIDKDAIYFLAKKNRKGTLIFIKTFTNELWCTYPLSLKSLGAHFIESFDGLSSFTPSDTFHIFKEEKGGCTSLESFKDVKDGDVLIITGEDRRTLNDFVIRYQNHKMYTVIFKSLTFPVFLLRSIPEDELESALHSYFSTHVKIIPNESGNRVRENNEVVISSDNRVVVYVTAALDKVDVNLITHIHPLLLPPEFQVNEVLSHLRNTGIGNCIEKVLNETPNIQITETFRNTIEARILSKESVLKPNPGLLIIQPIMKNPLRISFYTGAYLPSSYPFFIENPGTVYSLREKYFFTNKIVCFDGKEHVECPVEYVLPSDTTYTIMIERD